MCDNTLSAALGEGAVNGTKSSIRHTKFSASRLTSVSARLMLETQADAMNEAIRALTEQTVTDAQWSAFVQALTPVADDASSNAQTRAANTRATLTQLWNNDPRVSDWRGTAFGALQAVNTFDLWERGTRGDITAESRRWDELLGGKLAAREVERADVLAKVLATH